MTDELATALEQYAEAAVYRREYEGTAHAEIFRRLVLSEGEVAAAAGHWGKRMLSELEAGDPSLLLRFAKVYGRLEHQVRLRRPAPSEVKPEFTGPQRALKPSFPARAMAPLAAPAPVETGGSGVAAGPAAPQVTATHLVPSYLRALEQRADQEAPQEAFATREAAAPRPVQAASSPRPTIALPDLETGAALGTAAAGATGGGAAVGGALPDPDETAMVNPFEAAKGAGLPFEKGSTIERLELLRRAAREASAAREGGGGGAPAEAGAPEQRGTMALGDDLDVGLVLPFDGPAAVRPEEVDLSMFPLERYAELSVALASDDDRPRVLRRFVLTEAMWRAIAQAWGARITQEPALKREFDAAIARLRAAR